MSVLQTKPANVYNSPVTVAARAEYRARNGVTDRETMEKALPPLLSNINLVVVAG